MPLTNTDILRRAIKESGKRLIVISRETGIPYSPLWRFTDGTDIVLETADELATHFGLMFQPMESVAQKKVKKKPAAKPVKNIATQLSTEKSKIRANRAATKKATK